VAAPSRARISRLSTAGAARDRLADQLGESLAALHQLRPPAINDWWPAGWPAFVAHQRAGCVSQQRALGLPALWADQIPAFLDAVALPACGTSW
jgi:hygromycin-B 7''-O-kinase